MEPLPDPLAPELMVAQLASLLSVQAQPAGAVSVRLTVPPPDTTETEAGDTE